MIFPTSYQFFNENYVLKTLVNVPKTDWEVKRGQKKDENSLGEIKKYGKREIWRSPFAVLRVDPETGKEIVDKTITIAVLTPTDVRTGVSYGAGKGEVLVTPYVDFSTGRQKFSILIENIEEIPENNN